MPTRAATPAIWPMFIAGNVGRSIAFYTRYLGFEVTHRVEGDDPFFAIIARDGAQIFLKHHDGIVPVPNCQRHPWLRIDAHVHAPDPDALAAEFVAAGATFSSPLQDTDDGLRGFEITDPDGYVLFFGRPR